MIVNKAYGARDTFVLDVDASREGLSGVLLSQFTHGTERVVESASRTLTKQEHPYCTTHR